MLYNYEGLLAMKIEDLFDKRLAGQEAAKQRELEKNYFILSADDKFRVHLCKRFMLGSSGKIQHIEIHEVDLIFVLNDQGEIFVLNHTLRNDEDGLIFRFKDPLHTARLIDFFLPLDKDWMDWELDGVGARATGDREATRTLPVDRD